jgi:Putative MetA-pathway of phenol degradation
VGRSLVVRAAFLAASLSAAGGRAAAEEPPLVADRPGFGESASAVPPRHVQVEVGATWTRVDGETRIADLPEGLVRVGIVNGVELRIVAPEYFRSWGDDRMSTGWTDTALGVKGHVAVGGNDLALRGTLYLPGGSPAYSPGDVDPEVALAWSHDLSDRWSLGATVGQRWFRPAHVSLTSPSVSLGLSLGPRAGTFLEYGANVGSALRPIHRLDHGYTWSPNAHSQVDATVGVALSRAAPDFFVEAGYVRRF